MAAPGQSPDQLALAVSGLGGLLGFLALPTAGAWLRLFLRWVESDRSGLAPRRPIFGFPLLRALSLSLASAFFFISLVRSAGDLRELWAQAPVFGHAATGFGVGALFWAGLALAVRTLQKDLRRRRPPGLAPRLR